MGADEGRGEGQAEESLGDIFDEINLFWSLICPEPSAEAWEPYRRGPGGPVNDWVEPPAPEISVRTRNEIRKAELTKAQVMGCPDREALEGLPLPPWAIEELARELVRLAVWWVVAEAGDPGPDRPWPSLRHLPPLCERAIRWEVVHFPGGVRTIHPGPPPDPEPDPAGGPSADDYFYFRPL
jgi:hypothetical protein